MPLKTQISASILDRLKSEIERTGVGSTRLSTISKNSDRFVPAYFVQNIINGRVKNANEEELDYVFGLYESLSDGNIKLTKDMKRFLKLHNERFTSIPLSSIANHKSKPQFLTAYRIEQLIKHQKGDLNQEEWNFVKDQLNSVKTPLVKSLISSDYKHFQNLMRDKKISTIRLRKFLKVKHGKEFKVPFLQGLLDESEHFILFEDWNLITQSIHEIPSIKTNKTYMPKQLKIPLSKEMVNLFCEELVRSNTEFGFLLYNSPEGLKFDKQTLSKIKNGRTKHICPDLWEYLTSTLKERPTATKPKRQIPLKRTYQKITRDHVELLHFYRSDTGFEPSDLIKRSDNVPIGLDSYMIKAWMSEKTKSAEEEFLTWVLCTYRNLSDKGIKKHQ